MKQYELNLNKKKGNQALIASLFIVITSKFISNYITNSKRPVYPVSTLTLVSHYYPSFIRPITLPSPVSLLQTNSKRQKYFWLLNNYHKPQLERDKIFHPCYDSQPTDFERSCGIYIGKNISAVQTNLGNIREMSLPTYLSYSDSSWPVAETSYILRTT